MTPINKRILEINKKAAPLLEETTMRIRDVVAEAEISDVPLQRFFRSQGQFLIMLWEHKKDIESERYYLDNDFETLQKNNHLLYEDILPEQYHTSFVNPTYAVDLFGKELGQCLSAVAYVLRECVAYTYEGHLGELLRAHKLLLNIYDLLIVEGNRDSEVLVEIIRKSQLDNIDDRTYTFWFRSLSPEFNAYNQIAKDADLTDLRYLFRYGMYIGSNEVAAAKHLETLSHETKQRIADTITEAYQRAFKRNSVSLEDKSATLVTYHIGWEQVIRVLYKNLKAMGLDPVVYYHTRPVPRPRLYNSRPNRQMEYDHRFSDAIFFDENYKEALLASHKRVLPSLKDVGTSYAGLALMEPFGEAPFKPENHDANVVYEDAVTKLKSSYNVQVMAEYRKVVRGDNYSFVICDYPLPSIGDDYEAIYKDIIEVNALDEGLYRDIQEKMIDALDKASYVHITGAEGNETDLKVALHDLDNPSAETKFTNCTAEVNVPVGEVYTTPKLKGTSGLLHVKEVYLTGLKYEDLKIWFEDGMIAKCDCKNFGDDDEANRNFVHETLIHPHKTLPLGEFAIGTNTTAYMVAKKHKINPILPILIGEKTGPHFAIGDTCYLWSEDQKTYNSNGKEIKPKDNAISIKRKTDVEKAYLNKHTDITIPYHELDSIVGYDGNGGEYRIIDKGRFVLEGTEVLNQPFDEEK